MKKDMALCRNSYPHAWDEIPTTRRPQFGYLIVSRCMRCGTERDDLVDSATFELRSRAYRYPPGYKEIPRVTRSEWRASKFTPSGRRRRLYAI